MPYVRSAWYVAGWEQDLEPQRPMAMRILGDPIVLYRGESGDVFALEDRCVHRLAPLSLGRCEGDRLRCMYHGLLFDPDGRVSEIPGQAQIPAKARVRAYPTVVRHSWIWVWMGEAERADASLIPPAVGFDDPDFILGRGQLDYAAEARLINDNLLDFSHLTYVHANSFGATEDWARNRPQVIPLERGVRVQRWLPNHPGMVTRRGSNEPFDRWSTYDFLLPGILLMTGGTFPLGTAEACGNGPPDMALAQGGVTFTSQAVTPVSDRESRYFFSWGPHVRHGDAALRDILMGIAAQAFDEDKVMIEAQQRVVDAAPGQDVMPTSADKGVTLFNRLVERLSNAEMHGDLPAPNETDAPDDGHPPADTSDVDGDLLFYLST